MLTALPALPTCSPRSYVKDNYPALQLTVSDLSPFYLAEARSNMAVSRESQANCGAWACACPLGRPFRDARCRQRVGTTRPQSPPPAPPAHPAPPAPQYWKRMRAPDAQLGGVDGTGATFLQTAAEKLDVPDNSQDIV